MLKLVPEMQTRKLHFEDILYSKRDLAEEIYFMHSGKIALYFDLSEFVDMCFLLKPNQFCFNIPLVVFGEGSHFGDNESLTKRSGIRQTTAICKMESTVYYIKVS